ncbi:MAG: moeA [Firmicutes bacterium]|nr:moeA [Bacillota bacterium]
MDFLHCMEFDKAQKLIYTKLGESVVDAELVELSAALGRITSEAISATEDLPPFARATVDGYAVRSEDTFGASESAAALFSIVGEIWMGQETKLELHPGEAAVIPTGGMLPLGADAAVMLEYTEQPDPQTLLGRPAVAISCWYEKGSRSR